MRVSRTGWLEFRRPGTMPLERIPRERNAAPTLFPRPLSLGAGRHYRPVRDRVPHQNDVLPAQGAAILLRSRFRGHVGKDEIAHEGEVFLFGINLVLGKRLVDLQVMPRVADFHAADVCKRRAHRIA